MSAFTPNKGILSTKPVKLRSEEDKEITALIKRIKHLMPINKDNKLECLHEIISYIETMINGDPISQHIVYTYSTPYAKKALEEIMQHVQKHSLETIREEKRKLTEEVEMLTKKQTGLTENIDQLTKEQTSLKSQVESLTKERKDIDKDLQDKKENGLRQIEIELSNERKNLEEKNEELQKIANNLREEISRYNNQINGLNKPKIEIVTWEPIDKNDPIYNTNSENIDDYINALKLMYCEKTNTTLEEANKQFLINCPELETFTKILKYFTYSDSHSSSVKRIIDHYGWNEYAMKRAKMLKDMLKSIKMPKYQMTKNTPNLAITNTTLPDNMNTLLRELQFQKIVLESYAAKQIAEYNLQTVINILAQFIPSDMDLNNLAQYGIPVKNNTELIEEPIIKK